MFEYYITTKKKVKGTAIKRGVVFNLVKKDKNIAINPTGAVISLEKESSPSNLPEFGTVTKGDEYVPNEKPFGSYEQPSTQPDKNNEKLLQDLKIEYYKYKHQLSNLKETYQNLKNKVDIEKSRSGMSTGTNINCKYIYSNYSQRITTV